MRGCLYGLMLAAIAPCFVTAEPAAEPKSPNPTNHSVSATGKVEEFKKLSLAQLMDIEVTTISRTESTLGQSAAAVFVITPEMIDRSGATTIPELFRMVPGMHVARLDGNKWAVASRGFDDRFAKNLLVQVDGRSVYSPLTAGVFWDAVDYPLEDIERIEVIRGPGGSVWGANAVSGVVNIITKSTKDTQGGLVTMGGGNEVQGFGTVRYGGKIRDDLFFRIYGKGLNQDKQFSMDGANDQWWVGSGGVRMDWIPSERDTFTFDGSYTHSVQGTKDRFPHAMTNAAGLFSPNIPETEPTDDAHLLASWSRELDADSSWKLQAYWDGWEHKDDPHRFRHTRFDTFDLDFQNQFPLGERQKVVWGLGYRFVEARLYNSSEDGGFDLTWLDNNPHSQLFNGFLQDEIALVKERLSLTLGTKLEHNSFTGFEVQPSFRLLWTPTIRQSVWAAISRAVRTPSFTEDDALLALPNLEKMPSSLRLTANRNLQAETVWANELGYRIQATEALSFDAAVFYNVHDRLRVTRVNSSLSTTVQGVPLAALQFTNGMSGETYGAELAATWRVTDWWRLYGTYTYLRMHLHRDTGVVASAEAAEGKDPQQQVYLQSSFNLPANVELDLIGRFVDRLSGFGGSTDTVNDYVAFDARLAWRPSQHWELSVVGQNLLEDHHPEFGTNPFVSNPQVEIERAVYGKITYRW